jgi:segregation and condensation protein B
MSLKAKLEAVIYAAEEPVTLAQLAVLFAADALEWKAAQEAASAEQAAEATATEPFDQGTEEFAYAEFEPAPVVSTPPEVLTGPGSPAEEPAEDLSPESVPQSVPEAVAETIPETSPDASSSVAETEPAQLESAQPAAETEQATHQADPQADAKRLARVRDREVRAVIRQLLDELIDSCASDGRGVEIREIAGGYRIATKPEYHDAVRAFVKSLKPPLKLSLPALETLAVIAYKQPVTAPEVNEIRGVDSAGVFGSLLARKLIATAGRKQVIGRPILYKTTREFLLRFGLKDVSELPSMEEFEKMAAVELDEPEPTSEGESERGSNPSTESNLEFDENDAEQSIEESDLGAVPESAATPAEQETPVADQPAPMPVVTTAQNLAETPAETAAEPSAATKEVESPGVNPEHQLLSADEPAAIEPANHAESTPAEAAPAAPSSTEQAEIETFPNDR